MELAGQLDAAAQADLDAERAELEGRFHDVEERLADLHAQLDRDSLTLRDASGQAVEIRLEQDCPCLPSPMP